MADADDGRKINGFSIFGLIVFVAVSTCLTVPLADEAALMRLVLQ